MRDRSMPPWPRSSTTWAEYVQRHLDTLRWDNATLSRRAKIDRSLIGRWLNDGTQPTVQSVRAVAHALGRDIREALVAAGALTEEEMKVPPPSAPDMSMLDDDKLLSEVRRRMAAWRQAPAHAPDSGSDDFTTVSVAADR